MTHKIDHLHISDFDSKISRFTGVISLYSGKKDLLLCEVQ